MIFNKFYKKPHITIDKCTRRGIFGWGINWRNPSDKVELVIKINDETVGSIIADQPRLDLVTSNKLGDGHLSFKYEYPAQLTVDREHKVEVFNADTDELVFEYVFMPVQNILVIGKAKTGTTVISKTIEKSLPGDVEYHLEPRSSSFFESDRLLLRGSSHVVKMIFEHWHAAPNMRRAIVHNETSMKFEKVVCILRDVRDEILSRLIYWVLPLSRNNNVKQQQLEQWLEILNYKEEHPNDLSIRKMYMDFAAIFDINVDSMINGIIFQSKNYQRFINNISRPFIVVRYEKFMSTQNQELSSYLNLELNNDRSVDDLEHTRRSANYNNWKQAFTEEDVEYFRPKLEPILSKQGYTDWTLQPVDKLDEEVFSLYVKRIITEESV